MHADEPADLAAERWQAALFPGHPLGRETLGTAASVRRIGPEEIALPDQALPARQHRGGGGR